jgi:hypothetical protein
MPNRIRSPPGRPSSVDFLTGSVAINAHGNVDADTLQQIVTTIGTSMTRNGQRWSPKPQGP